ncbi:MAG: universal stress protein [Desulfobacterales bacterium]|nr:universal stress protein [Desulfobacterales bacterium]
MRILVYTDGRPTTDRALAFAAEWAQRLAAELAVITVRSETHAMEAPPPLGRAVTSAEWQRLPEGLQVLTAAAHKLADTGLMPLPADIVIRETPHSHFFSCPSAAGPPIRFHERFGHFIEALNREIDRDRIDLLIIAPPRRSRVRRLVLGDTTRKLALELHTSVLIVREGRPESPPVICADGSSSGKRAFPLMQKLLPAIPSPVGLMWVRTPETTTEETAQALDCLEQARQWLASCGRESRLNQIEHEHPADAITATAGDNALVIIGASLRHDVYRRTRGSLPIRLLGSSRASILLVKTPPEANPGNDKNRFAC